MARPIENFISELRADPRFGPAIADQIATAHEAVAVAAKRSPGDKQFRRGLDWIIGHENRSVDERFEMIFSLLDLLKTGGQHVINLPRFTGWKEEYRNV